MRSAKVRVRGSSAKAGLAQEPASRDGSRNTHLIRSIVSSFPAGSWLDALPLMARAGNTEGARPSVSHDKRLGTRSGTGGLRP